MKLPVSKLRTLIKEAVSDLNDETIIIALEKAKEIANYLSDRPHDKYDRCVGHIMEALLVMGVGSGDPGLGDFGGDGFSNGPGSR